MKSRSLLVTYRLLHNRFPEIHAAIPASKKPIKLGTWELSLSVVHPGQQMPRTSELLGILRGLASMRNIDTFLKIYKTFIRPLFDYRFIAYSTITEPPTKSITVTASSEDFADCPGTTLHRAFTPIPA